MTEQTTTQPYIGPERRRPDPAHAAAIEQAVAAGIRAALSDATTWDAAARAMREHAQSAAGGWLIGGLITLAKRAAWIALFCVAAYQFSGWSGVASLIRTQGTHP